MTRLGNGLYEAKRYEDALSVKEAELAMLRRLGAPEYDMLVVQSNLANSYQSLGKLEEALPMRRVVYSGTLKMFGEESRDACRAAINYALSLMQLQRYQESKSLSRRTLPVALRVLGESHELTLRMRWYSAMALYEDPGATLDDLRKAVTTLEDTERIARRVLGGAHPTTKGVVDCLPQTRAKLHACETLGGAA